MSRSTTLFLLALAFCLAACMRHRSPPPNVVLIVVDTLRADRLGVEGNVRGLTPFMDSLAARGYVFHNTYAQSSWTNPSVASLVTSRYQSQHGIISFASVLAESEVTLAEVLKQRGYRTGFFSANGLIARRTKYDQGYEEFASLFSERQRGPAEQRIPPRADRLNRDALAWLDKLRAGGPIFLHMHYMEPHQPYAPLPEALAHVADGGRRPDVASATSAVSFFHQTPIEPDALRNLVDVYDAEVRSIDIGLRVLFAALERRGILDNAVVVITADHGEEFMEHGLLGHDKTLFNEVIKVPLIMLVPGHTKRTDIRQVVPLTSVAPTLVELAGGSIPSSFAGHSLKDGLIPDSTRWWWPWAGAEVEGAAYTELIKPHQPDVKRSPPHQHAVVVGSRKLIVGLNGEREYYDLAADPSEKNPNALNEEQRADVDAVYDQFRALAQQRAAPREREELDAETKERMRALGYDH